MSLLDDNRAARERLGITEAEWMQRDRGLYGGGYWAFEPLRHPEAIKRRRDEHEAMLDKHLRDQETADDLKAENTIPWWEQDEIDKRERIARKAALFARMDAKLAHREAAE